jgi:hypothetical protein
MTPFFSRAARLPGSLLSSVIDLVGAVIRFFPLLVRSRSALSAEVLFLRKQLAFYEERQVKPRRLNNAARLSLVVWSRLFEWKDALVIVKPETLLRWHRKGFRLFWKWKSRVGRWLNATFDAQESVTVPTCLPICLVLSPPFAGGLS